jgi:kynurenine formamidase
VVVAAMSLLDYLAQHPVRVLDLGRPLQAGMPASPTHGGFESTLRSGHGGAPRADGMTGAHEVIAMSTHIGTHVDALCHVAVDGRIADGRSIEVEDGRFVSGGIDEFALAVRRAVLVDVPLLRGVDRLDAAEPVTAADLAHVAVPIGPGDAVLVRTGWAQLWSEPQRYVGADAGAPGLDESAARWLAERQVSLVGADTVALECIRPEIGHRALPVHRLLLATAGINLVEVMNLEPVAGRDVFALVCAPLSISGASGSPVRPVALVDVADEPVAMHRGGTR